MDDAQIAVQIAEALRLLALDRADDARDELESLLRRLGSFSALPPVPVEPIEIGEPLEDSELDRAFADAEPEPDEMMDANRMAQEAMRAEALDAPEGVLPITHSPFATRTVADLLERQGHDDEARALRVHLDGRGSNRGTRDRNRVIATLERWLENLRGNVA